MTEQPTQTVLSEDDIYRASSQYRLWSFSPERLAALRQKTHNLAIERAREYSQGDEANTPRLPTAEEELRLVQKHCDMLRATSDFFRWDNRVKATAVQYLRRFYLTNSCLTYPPREIYKTVLYLASKAETTHTNVHEFARRIATDADQVLAAEYKVIQSLRFTLDVRQPWRGLKGMLMELLNTAAGDARDGAAARHLMARLDAPTGENKTLWRGPAAATPADASDEQRKMLEDRVNAAYSVAKTVLDAPALLTDAYFLYTPSQIALASLVIADTPLAEFYISTKVADSSPLKVKIMSTIGACAQMLASFDPASVMSKGERAEIDARVDACRDPATKDLVARNREAKRGTEEENAEKAKKRRLEREKSEREGEALFGPEIKK